MSAFKKNVNSILAQRDAEEAADSARERAVEEAKPAAFNAFAATCVDAADLLAERGIRADARWRAVVGHLEERGLLSRKIIKVPKTGWVAGWVLCQGWKTVDRGGPSFYNDPSWRVGMMFDTKGQLYRFRERCLPTDILR